MIAKKVEHLAGIIPVAGPRLGFNMPWDDCLMPIADNYHAIERAVHTAAVAGCNTIWIIMNRDMQPLVKKKLGEWVYDPSTIWQPPDVYLNKTEIPLYYVAVHPRDRLRKDSYAWSSLYGARVSAYVSMKISKWLIPTRFLVVSPYGVIDEVTMKNSRDLLRAEKNIAFRQDGNTFLDNTNLPFTFMQSEFDLCKKLFKEQYTGNDVNKQFSEVFAPINIDSYSVIDTPWFYNISSWAEYSRFLGSSHNKLCTRPKYLLTKKWYGLVKDRDTK